jgi:Tfp pilus assembly protein PilN
MIEINLLPGQKRKKKAAAGFAMPDFKGMLTQVKDPLLLGAVGTWAVVIAAVAFLYVSESHKLSAMQGDVTRVQAEATRFQALINQKKKEEALRDSLVMQFDAIRRIDGDRYIWPHILEEITKALPDYTWLQAVNFQPVAVTDTSDSARAQVRVLIDGRTADMGGYTRFLRQLADSPWLTNIVAGPTKAVVESDKPVLSFTITVTYRQADSAFIRTAPVVQSVQ